jgi:hypothetical protein
MTLMSSWPLFWEGDCYLFPRVTSGFGTPQRLRIVRE